MSNLAVAPLPDPAVAGDAHDAESPAISRILQHPAFLQLRASRGRLATRLSLAMLAIYYGFILLIAFAPSTLATPVFGVVSLGILLGLAVIVSAIVLTGIYVAQANSRYDALIHEITRSAE